MRASTTLSVAALAALASAAPRETRSVGGEIALYWGQDASNETLPLSNYCSGQDVNIVIMSFLDSYGDGESPSGSLGDCSVDTSSGASDNQCPELAANITYCQQQGVKVFISLGGAGATGTITSEGDATGLAGTLWNSFAAPAATSGQPRPFGDSYVDGWDWDIESVPGNSNNNSYYADAITALRGYFASDSDNTYYISGAPQCVVPDANMGGMITDSQFDYLFIQFYNTPQCAAYQVVEGNDNAFTFDDWYSYAQEGASNASKLLIGIPGAVDAADPNDPAFYISPKDLPTLLNTYGTHSGYGGVMIYDAGTSDQIDLNGCHYDEEVSSVLTTGSPCS